MALPLMRMCQRRDTAGAVSSRSLTFFSRFTSCVLFTAYHDFSLIIVGVATFVATRSNKGRWGRVEVSEGVFLSLLLSLLLDLVGPFRGAFLAKLWKGGVTYLIYKQALDTPKPVQEPGIKANDNFMWR